MASAVFRKIKSLTDNMRYVVEWSTAGRGLPRRKQQTAVDMTTVTKGRPRNYPVGVDRRAPFLPGDVAKGDQQ